MDPADAQEFRHFRSCMPQKKQNFFGEDGLTSGLTKGTATKLAEYVPDQDNGVLKVVKYKKNAKVGPNPIEKWFLLEKDARKSIQEYESSTLSRFTCTRNQAYDISKGRVKWIETSNTPYIISRNIFFLCKFGRKNRKMISQGKQQQLDESTSMECNASITLLEVFTFPQYKFDSNMKKGFSDAKKKASEIIRHSIHLGSSDLVKQLSYCVKIPAENSHTCHLADCEIPENGVSHSFKTANGVTQVNINCTNGEIPTDSSVILWTNTVDEAFMAVEQFEITTLTKFIFRRKHTCDVRKSRVHWDEITHTPYIITQSKQLECQHGKDRNKASNEKRRQSTLALKYGTFSDLPQKKKQSSKKLDCKAVISIFQVWKFPQHRIFTMSDYLKTKASRAIRKALSEGGIDLIKEDFCQVRFPANVDHTGHVIGEAAGVLQYVDPRIISKIYEMVGNGVDKLEGIQAGLRQFVVRELFEGQAPPSDTNRRFFPTPKDIRNHLYKAIMRLGRNIQHRLEYGDGGIKSAFSDCDIAATVGRQEGESADVQEDLEEQVEVVVVEGTDFDIGVTLDEGEEQPADQEDGAIHKIGDLLNTVRHISYGVNSQPALAQTERDLANIIANLSNASSYHSMEAPLAYVDHGKRLAAICQDQPPPKRPK